MKITKKISFFTFLVMFLPLFSVACNISGLTVTKSDCNANNKFSVTIDFDVQDPAGDNFKVTGNGTNYGTFAYSQLPIVIDGLPGNCTTNFEFVIRDVVQATCVAEFILGQVCCIPDEDCALKIINLEPGACDGETYPLSFDLEYTGVDNTYYDVWSGSTYVGYFPFETLPAYIPEFPASGGNFDTLIVCQNDNALCCDTMIIEAPCSCSLKNLQTQIVNCNTDEETYFLKVNFQHAITSDSFEIGANQNYFGKHGYNELPITVGPLSFSTDSVGLFVVDDLDVLCFDEVLLPPNNACDTLCAISNISYHISDCNDLNQFYVNLSFDYNNPGVLGFRIRGNGVNYGTFYYGQGSYKVGPLNGNCSTIYEFVIEDIQMPTCHAGIHLSEPVCCGSGDCSISNLIIGTLCDASTSSIKLSFSHNQPATDLFYVQINNNQLLGPYAYGSLPLTIAYPFIEDAGYLIRVIDADLESCNAAKEFVYNCVSNATCHIENLTVVPSDCNANGNFYVTIDFYVTSPNSDHFKVMGNGVNYGTFAYSQLPIIIDGLDGNCTTPYEFVVKDFENAQCSASINLGPICCDGNSDCSIEIVDVQIGDCTGDQYTVTFNLSYSGTNNANFEVWNGSTYIGYFPFTSLPKTIHEFPALGSIDSLIVCQNDNSACCDTYLVESPCSCDISNIETHVVECNADNQTYYLKVDFDHTATSDSFEISLNQVYYGEHAYNQLPIYIGPISMSSDAYNLFIVDSEHPLCFAETNLSPVVGCNTPCAISNLNYTVGDCNNDGKFYVTLSFDVNNPGNQGFKIVGNGVNYGTFQYGQTSYVIGPLAGNCETIYEFVIKDIQFPDCSAFVVLPDPVCCGNSDCEIGNLTITPNCDATTPTITINFAHNQPTTDQFYITVNNGTAQGPFTYGSLPLAFSYGFVEDQGYAIKVIDADVESCYKVKEYVYNCVENNCHIYDLIAEAGPCNVDGFFFVDIDFQYTNPTSDQFYIYANDQQFGPYTYGSQNFYTIGPLSGDCIIYHFKVKDKINGDCYDTFNFEEEICCGEDAPCAINAEVVGFECVDNHVSHIKVKVTNSDPTLVNYKIRIKGITYGPFNYSTTPIVIDIQDAVEGVFDFRVQDVANSTCVKEFNYTFDCNTSAPCSISEIVAKGIDCTEQLFKFHIDFNVNNAPSDSFNLIINSVFIGRYAYSQLPITTTQNFLLSENQVYVIKIFDSAMEACKAVKEVTSIDCISGTSNVLEFNTKATMVNDIISIYSVEDQGMFQYQLLDIVGRRLDFGKVIVGKGTTQIIPHNVSPGMVILLMQSTNNSTHYTFKLMHVK